MSISEMFSDALAYPFNNIKALLLYVVLGIIVALLGGATIVDFAVAFTTKGVGGAALAGLGIVGVILFVLVVFLVEGYALDIIKYGIERRSDGPGIDFGRQVSNAIKLVVVSIVYYVVPAIITLILSLFLRDWLIAIIGVILFIVFALANFMAKCRLAKTDNLGDALAIGEAIGDISRVGIGNLLITVIVVFVILMIIAFIVAIFMGLNQYLGGIILGFAGVYFVFFYNRVIGLLYSTA
ncbi:DUF4013 domain-containing protein [Methanobrevibacter sp.]|uniref:DUF4013 domain-containing protein n=1 Tax=Methanobrevibacter sp. TaxID=66852 RepID=UPI0025F1886B|nr:DUF4013 domain-containing protein [Methanobrevibacter sp.]MEE0024359.1 DUF4013 domain-containing protein [Methanobrevibacter sp.]